MITLPSSNDDVRNLWKNVAECAQALNALQNMTVVVEGKVKMLGTLTLSGSSSRLEIKEASEVQG